MSWFVDLPLVGKLLAGASSARRDLVFALAKPGHLGAASLPPRPSGTQQGRDLEFFATVVRQTDVPVAMTDPLARLVYVNPAWERMTGWTLHDVLGKTPGDILHGEQTDAQTRSAMHDALVHGRSFSGDVINYRRDGSPYWLHVDTTPVRDNHGEVMGFIAIERDISGQRAVEQELRRERAFAASLLEALPDGIFALDRDVRVLEWNPAMVQLTGIARADAIGRSIDDLVPVPQRLERCARLRRVFTHGTQYADEWNQVFPRAGNARTVSLTISAISDPISGMVTAVLGTVQDVTAHRSAEDALRESEVRRQALVQSASAVIIGVTPHGLIFEFNGAAERLYGTSRNDALHQSFLEQFVPDDLRARLNRELQLALAGAVVRNVRTASPAPDGAILVMRWNLSPIRGEEGRILGAVLMGEDLSEQIAADERFRVTFESSSDGQLLFDESGVMACNRAALALYGVQDATELLSLDPASFAPAIQPDGTNSRVKKDEVEAEAYRLGTHRFDWMLRRPDRSERLVEVTLTAVRMGGRQALHALLRDAVDR